MIAIIFTSSALNVALIWSQMLNDKLLNPNNDLHLDSTSTFPEANVIKCPHSLLSIGYPCDGVDSWIIVLAEVFDDFVFFWCLQWLRLCFHSMLQNWTSPITNWVAARDVRADFSTARIKADAQGALPLEARPPDYEFRTSRLHWWANPLWLRFKLGVSSVSFGKIW